MHVICCVPGARFSGHFMESWTELVSYFHFKGIRFTLSRGESPNIYFARNACLGGNTLRGKVQKPFDSKLDYTHMLWIDSDMVFSPEHFEKLLAHNADFVSGIYRTADNIHYATVVKCDIEYFKKYGRFEFLSDKNITADTMEVAYTGFGFVLIKAGVVERMTYPWFHPKNFITDQVFDFCTEDVSFCAELQKLGVKVMVDTTVKVGHEKSIILR